MNFASNLSLPPLNVHFTSGNNFLVTFFNLLDEDMRIVHVYNLFPYKTAKSSVPSL